MTVLSELILKRLRCPHPRTIDKTNDFEPVVGISAIHQCEDCGATITTLEESETVDGSEQPHVISPNDPMAIVRALAESQPIWWDGSAMKVCALCQMDEVDRKHDPDCPWIAARVLLGMEVCEVIE